MKKESVVDRDRIFISPANKLVVTCVSKEGLTRAEMCLIFPIFLVVLMKDYFYLQTFPLMSSLL